MLDAHGNASRRRTTRWRAPRARRLDAATLRTAARRGRGAHRSTRRLVDDYARAEVIMEFVKESRARARRRRRRRRHRDARRQINARRRVGGGLGGGGADGAEAQLVLLGDRQTDARIYFSSAPLATAVEVFVGTRQPRRARARPFRAHRVIPTSAIARAGARRRPDADGGGDRGHRPARSERAADSRPRWTRRTSGRAPATRRRRARDNFATREPTAVQARRADASAIAAASASATKTPTPTPTPPWSARASTSGSARRG